MGLLFGGIACIVIAIILVLIRASKKKSLFSILSAPKRSCKDIQETAKQVAEEIGSGSFSERCKLWGKAETDSPLTSELAGQECVYYSATVYRKYEDYEIYTDSEGYEKERRVTREESLSSNTQQVPFKLNDGTGEVEVSLNGASVQGTVKMLDQFVPGEADGGSLSWGDFAYDIGGVDYGASTTLGYRYVEYGLPVGRNLLVVGNATDASGQVRIEKPADSDYKYVVSTKSEEEYISGAKSSINALNIASIVLGSAGVILSILQFVLKR